MAVSHLFPGKEITIDSRCLQSGDRIRVRMRDSDVLEVSPNLAIPSWTTTGIEHVGTGAGPMGFNAVTNRISIDAADAQFLNLTIEFTP